MQYMELDESIAHLFYGKTAEFNGLDMKVPWTVRGVLVKFTPHKYSPHYTVQEDKVNTYPYYPQCRVPMTEENQRLLDDFVEPSDPVEEVTEEVKRDIRNILDYSRLVARREQGLTNGSASRQQS